MTKPIDAETESAASDILSLKGKPEALERFVATYVAQHEPEQVDKVRQFLESKGETIISKQFVPDAKITPTHIDLGPSETKVSVAEFKALAQKDIDEFKKDLAEKTAGIVTIDSEKRTGLDVFRGKFHSEIAGKAKVDFDDGKIGVTDSNSGIKYKFDLYSQNDNSLIVSYPNGSERTIKGRGEPDVLGASFAARTAEGFVGCASDKTGILIALPDKVLDIDTHPRHLLPGKDMHTEAIETRPARMYVDKRNESLGSENYGNNGKQIEQLIAEVKEVEPIMDKANQLIAEFKGLVEKNEAAPVVVESIDTAYGYFMGKLHSEIPGKIKLDDNKLTIVVDDLVSGAKYKFATNSQRQEEVTISDSNGRENIYKGEISQTRGDGRHVIFSANTPDGTVGFARYGEVTYVVLPDKALDIRWEPRELIGPKHLKMDPIEVSPPRMFLDKRDASYAIENFDFRGKPSGNS